MTLPFTLNKRAEYSCLSGPREYVGRPTIWGNPFVIGRDGSREEVIAKYEEYLLNEPKLLRRLHELRGKHLVCWCAPKACHADVLIKHANKEILS